MSAPAEATFSHLATVAAVMTVALVVVTRSLLPYDELAHDQPAPLRRHPHRRARRARSAPLVLAGMFAGMFAVIAEITGRDWATFRLTDDFAATAALGSLAFAIYTLGMTTMRMSGDSLQLRLGGMGLHRLSIALAITGFVVAALIPNRTTGAGKVHRCQLRDAMLSVPNDETAS